MLVKELASNGDTLPLDASSDTTYIHDTKGSTPTRQSQSENQPSSQSTTAFLDLPSDNRYCSMTRTSSKPTEVNGGSLILTNRRNVDMGEPFVEKYPLVAAERQYRAAAGPVILADKTLSLRRTTGPGDVQQEQVADGVHRQKATELTQSPGKRIPVRTTLTRQVPVQKRPVAYCNRQHSLGNTEGETRNLDDAELDQRTFFYPNHITSHATSGVEAKTPSMMRKSTSRLPQTTPKPHGLKLLPTDCANIAKSEHQPLIHSNGQTIGLNKEQAEVACAPSSSTPTEQMAEDGYISLDLFANADYAAPDVADKTSTQLDDDMRRRNDDATGLPAHYPVDYTLSTRL